MTSTDSLFDPDWIGFDLDHTIARYKLDALHELTLNATIEWLHSAAHFPKDAFQLIHHDHPQLNVSFVDAFAVRGVVIDRRLGNVLRIDEHRRVYECQHGAQSLTADQIDATYHTSHTPSPAANAKDDDESNLQSFLFLTTQRYWPAHSYFETFLAPLFIRSVHWLDQANASAESYWPKHPQCTVRTYEQLTDAMHGALVHIYSKFHIGAFFEAFRRDPGAYLYQRPFVRQWVLRVRERAPRTRVFLATNSMAEFTDLLCRHIIGDDWIQLFDLVIFKARKPLFFSHGCAKTTLDPLVCYKVRYAGPLQPVIGDDPCFEMRARTPDDPEAHLFEGGCAAQAEAVFRRVSGKPIETDGSDNPIVVWYCGDHLTGDCRAASQCCRAWRACAVVEELAPLETRNAVPIASLCNAASSDQQYVRFDIGDPTAPRHHVEVYDNVKHAANAQFFFTPDGTLTYQAKILRDDCSLVVSDVHQLCSELNGDPLWMFRHHPHSNVQFVKAPTHTNKQ